MPILDIELVGAPLRPDGLAQRAADAAGGVFGSSPQRTWVKLRVIDASDYGENDSATQVRPVFVHLIKRRLLSGAARRVEALALAKAIGAACDRTPDNVHIIYAAEGAGRVAFGGVLIPDADVGNLPHDDG